MVTVSELKHDLNTPTAELKALAGFINFHVTHATCAPAAHSLPHSRQAGELLVLAKKALGHGRFIRWIERHLVVNYKEARDCMLLVARWDPIKYEEVYGLEPSPALRRMLATSKPRRAPHRTKFLPVIVSSAKQS